MRVHVPLGSGEVHGTYYLSRLLLGTPPGRSTVLQRRRALYGSMACPGGLVSGTILASTRHAHTELWQLAEIAKFGSGAFFACRRRRDTSSAASTPF